MTPNFFIILYFFSL